MHPKPSTIRYGIYSRKSSEQEDRQVASIDSQNRELNQLTQRDRLHVKRQFEESHSAKRPGRPVFNELLAAIEKGTINGLLTWSPNRISRNAIDTGIIIDLMDRDKLVEIRTPSQTYFNTPNDKFLLGLFCGQAKLENDNKGVDVKRGLRTKAENGIYPAPAPLGYMNDRFAERGNKTILPDTDRFDLLRKMFDLMLTGLYTPPRILAIANDEWGFRTPRGNKMSRSNIYNIFSRPFYYGRFEYPVGSGNWYTGAHKPMITEGEFRRIQSLLHRSTRPKQRPHSRTFPYRGQLRCGQCRAMITAESKTKRQKNGNVHRYTYYHCTKRKDPTCIQGSVREHQLEKEIERLLAQIEIPTHFRTWSLAYMETQSKSDASVHQALKTNLQRSLDGCAKKLDRIIDMRAGGELSEAEFMRKKMNLSKQSEAFRQKLGQLERNTHNWLKSADRLLTYAEEARSRFVDGDPDTRKDIFAALGSNLVLTDKKLSITGDSWVRPIQRAAGEVRAIYARLEPRKTRINYDRLAEVYANNPRMLRALDDVRSTVKDIDDANIQGFPEL